MVRSRFRGGIRTARIVGGRLDKKSRFPERAVDFVRADVMEPYIPPLPPETACCFERVKCANDVRLDKISRPDNGTVHMAFSGKVDDCSYVVFTQYLRNMFVIANISVLKYILLLAFLPCDIRQVQQIAGIGKLIVINDHAREFRPPQNVSDEI